MIGPPALLLRADASPTVGAGHLMRCLALATAWEDAGGRAVFACAQLPEGMRSTLQACGIRVLTVDAPPGGPVDAQRTRDIAQSLRALWVVVDLPGLTPSFQLDLRGNEARLMVVDDDGACGRYHAHAIVNPNVHAQPDLYTNRDKDCLLLLGSSFALLRPEFPPASRPAPRSVQAVRRILVTFGGADPGDVTSKTVALLSRARLRDAQIRVILGPAYEGMAGGTTEAGVEYVRAPPSMAAEYRWADLVICAGGTSVWEVLFMGVPCIALPAAANQTPALAALAQLELAFVFPQPDSSVKTLLQGAIAGDVAILAGLERRALKGRDLIDGRGAARVVTALGLGTRTGSRTVN